MKWISKIFRAPHHQVHDIAEIITTDFHSHLIPGIDDGVKTLEEASEIISFFSKLGYKKMITTPHISFDYYNNSAKDIESGFEKLKTHINGICPDMKLGVAAEYMIDDGFRKHFENRNLLTFGNNFLLVELSWFNIHPEFNSIIFDLQASGYNVILAHPERYSFWSDKIQNYEKLKERDIFLQLNLLSLTSYYSHQVNRTARKLIENNMIDFIGSDVHNPQQLPMLQKALGSGLLDKLLASGKILNNSL